MKHEEVAPALTLHLGNDSQHSRLRIVVDAPVIESRNGTPVPTVGISIAWESNRPRPDHASAVPLHESFASEVVGSAEPLIPREVPLSMPSRFMNWYLCEIDGTKWSVEVDDPLAKASCPACERQVNPIAMLGLPLDKGPEKPRKSECRFKLCRRTGT